jgi:hypothetical protein
VDRDSAFGLFIVEQQLEVSLLLNDALADLNRTRGLLRG